MTYLLEALKQETIDDLRTPDGRKVVVVPGVPTWITKEQRESSLCLKKLIHLGLVRASLGSSSREERKVSRPFAKKPRPPVLAGPPERKFTRTVAEEIANRTNRAVLSRPTKVKEEEPAVEEEELPVEKPSSEDGEVVATSGDPPKRPYRRKPKEGEEPGR